MHCHSITVSKEWKIASLSTIGGSCGIMSLRTSRGAKFSRILNRASEALKPLYGLSNRPLTGVVVLMFLMLINGMFRGASVSNRTVHVASARANNTILKMTYTGQNCHRRVLAGSMRCVYFPCAMSRHVFQMLHVCKRLEHLTGSP